MVASLMGGDAEEETAAVAEMAPPIEQHTTSRQQQPYSNRTNKMIRHKGCNNLLMNRNTDSRCTTTTTVQMRPQQPQVQVQQAQFASFESPIFESSQSPIT